MDSGNPLSKQWRAVATIGKRNGDFIEVFARTSGRTRVAMLQWTKISSGAIPMLPVAELTLSLPPQWHAALDKALKAARQ